MKQNNLIDVPDSIFEAFGFALPKSVSAPYQKGGSITDYVGGNRIISLKKENTYQEAYPIMNGIDILKLSYPSMPKEGYKQMEYVLQVISRHIKNILSSFQKDTNPKTSAEDKSTAFILSILEPFKDELQISHVNASATPAADIACAAFSLPSCYCIRLSCIGGETVYGAIGAKRRRKEGYYHFPGNYSQTAHLIDLIRFLSMAFVFSGINQIQASIKLPLVQDVFEQYMNKGNTYLPGKEKNMLAECIQQGKQMSVKHLFQTYIDRGQNRFYLINHSFLLLDAVQILCKVLEIYNDICFEQRHRSEIGRSIATAYITKKNIPQSVQDVMEKTSFIKYFKFVEFDEEVDLASVKAIEREFELLNSAYFSGRSFKEVTLRFRKLGKHKASGLYYPTLHTLCVDIRCPSSFIHEYFHMIDDQLGDLSLEVTFNQLVILYKEAFLQQMDVLDENVKNTLNGKSKYNLAYFFRRAEIFARCGEIYFTRIIKVESSLIKPDLTYAYPESEELDKKIKDYYELLLTERMPGYCLSAAQQKEV